MQLKLKEKWTWNKNSKIPPFRDQLLPSGVLSILFFSNPYHYKFVFNRILYRYLDHAGALFCDISHVTYGQNFKSYT